MHLDCLPDRAPGPCSISSAVRSSEGAWLHCSPTGSFGGRGIAWSRKVGELTIFLFPKLSEARAHFKH